MVLLSALFAMVVAAATASSGAPAAARASCNLRPFYGEYLCSYYGFVSGTHTERWKVDYDHFKRNPGGRCPYSTSHQSGGVDVTYASPRSGPKRAKFVTRWKSGTGPYDLQGGTPYFFFTVSLKRFERLSRQSIRLCR